MTSELGSAMDFNKPIKTGVKQEAGLSRSIPGAILQGASWHVEKRGDGHALIYMTGENPDREDEITLTGEEFARLASAGDEGHAVVTEIANDRYNKQHGLI